MLIASAERLPTFTAQRGDGGELLAFTDAEALRPVDAILGISKYSARIRSITA